MPGQTVINDKTEKPVNTTCNFVSIDPSIRPINCLLNLVKLSTYHADVFLFHLVSSVEDISSSCIYLFCYLRLSFI